MGAHGGAMSPTEIEAAANNAASEAAARPVDNSYFHNTHHQGWLYAHIFTMVVAWVMILPIGVMFSVTRSRLTIPAQVSFLAVNGLGVFTSIIYNANTPDLYPNNAHHKIGWVASWVALAWFVMALPMIYRSRKASASSPRPAMTAQNMAQYNRLQNETEFVPRHMYRWSRDSGHGSEGSGTLCPGSRADSSDSLPHHKLEPQSPIDEEHGHDFEEQDEPAENSGFLQNTRVNRFVSLKLSGINPSGKAFSVFQFLYVFLERTILLLGFVQIATGIVTWGDLFRDRLAFSGAAHFVKGGIFFWYGLLTLGRWMGAFADFGWAWNIKPRDTMISRFARRLPSAEFTESFVIWLYGASNVFLEHLNAWGKEWTFEDFEHISITIMFFGGGLLGMLVESETFKSLFNAGVSLKQEESEAAAAVAAANDTASIEEQSHEGFATPKTYRHSLNPMPALVILLLGRMMGGHVQASMVSTMMHAQWGNLFVGFAMARAATYVMLYISPPTSYFPSRPPTELAAAFCLISGGLIFMGSATDTVRTIEQNGLDAMFLFTVAMGFSALIMAWAAITFALKGWVMRREAKRL
ncbi:hypothetical protein AAFC00_006546 [Neodothiora populina]